MITTNTMKTFVFLTAIWIGQIERICGIPIIPPKAANNQNQNNPETHWQLPPQPRPHQVPHHHLHPSQNSNPEMEDFGRQSTNHHRFRRHATPPEGKMTNGPFQQNPSEPFANNYLFDEPQSNNFRHQPHGEMPPDNYQPFDPHMRNKHRYHNMPPPPSPLSPHHPRFRDGHRDDFDHTSNDVFPEKNSHFSQPEKNTGFQKISERLFQSSVFQAEKGLPDTITGALGGIARVRSESANSLSLPQAIQPPATVRLVILGPDGNSTLFIEYDVSDNDITYETTMEIEDMSDS